MRQVPLVVSTPQVLLLRHVPALPRLSSPPRQLAQRAGGLTAPRQMGTPSSSIAAGGVTPRPPLPEFPMGWSFAYPQRQPAA